MTRGDQRLYRIRQGSCDAEIGMYICKLGMYICARTIARMRQHADKEHSEQDPKIPRKASLCMVVNCSAFVGVVGSCVYLLVTVRVSACVHCCQPPCVGTLHGFPVVPRPHHREPDIVMAAFVQTCFYVSNY